MGKFRTLAKGAAIAALTSAPALAADLPRRSSPPPMPVMQAPPPVFTWTGFYVGLNAGAAINDSSFALAPFFGPVHHNGVGFTGGGQAGFNWQTGPLVLGAETDINYRGASSGSGAVGALSGVGNSSGYLGTARARAGYAIDRLLVFGTGGLAYGDTNFPNSIVGVDAFGAPHAFAGSNNSGIRAGWAAGGGAEYALTPNWSVKAEYLYTDLGHASTNYVDAPSAAAATATAHARDNVVRTGVNYHF